LRRPFVWLVFRQTIIPANLVGKLAHQPPYPGKHHPDPLVKDDSLHASYLIF